MMNQISIPSFDYKKSVTFLLSFYSVAFLILFGGITSGTVTFEKYSILLIVILVNIWLSGMFLAYDRHLYNEFLRENRVWTMKTDDELSDYSDNSLILFIITFFITIFLFLFAIAFTVVNQ